MRCLLNELHINENVLFIDFKRMSYPYSDEDSTDSDSGIRFKTTNTRHHTNKAASYDDRSRDGARIRPEYHRRNRSRSRSKERSNKREDRSKSKDYRKNRHRSRTPEKYDKHRRHTSKSSTEKYEKFQQKNSSKDNHLDLRTIVVKDGTTETTEKDEYGPKLPPKNKKETPNTSSYSQDDSFLGPALPPLINKPTTSNKQEQEDDTYGPTLPPIAKKPEPQVKDKSIVIGPTLPPHIRATLTEAAPSEILNSLQESDDDGDADDDDDDIVGPLPAGQSSSNPNFMKLEERALEMKLNGLNKTESDSKVREEWMLELPEVHTANLGLGPRQFRAKGVPDMSDRSSWTDTPQEKLNKASSKQKATKSDIKKEAELEHLKKRDLEQEKIVEKHKKKKKRDKSLLDIHQEKINKKKVRAYTVIINIKKHGK